MTSLEIFHIVRAFHVIVNNALTSRTKSFNCVLLSLLHLLIGVCLNTGDSFSSVDLIGIDGMSIQITNHLHGVDLTLNLHLIRLHGLLDFGTNLTKPGIDTRLPKSRISGVLHRLK